MKLLLLLVCSLSAFAQNPAASRFIRQNALPATCAVGSVVYDLGTSAFYKCATANTWTQFATGGVVSDAVTGASTLTTASVIPRVTASGVVGPSKLSCTGSPVICTLYDDTAVTGSAYFKIRSGASQNAYLMQFTDTMDADLAALNNAGNWLGSAFIMGNQNAGLFSNGLYLSNVGFTAWSSTAAYNGAVDVGIDRDSAGVAAVMDGVTGSNYRDFKVRDIIATSFVGEQHTISFVIDGGGSAVATGDVELFPTVPFDCTINRIDVSADQTGSFTMDVWARAGAIPTAAQKISASAPATLSMAQLSQNGSLTGWTTTVTAGDVFGGTVVTASTVERVMVQIGCVER